MLKDSEIKEICRIMERLSRYDDRLLRMAVHTDHFSSIELHNSAGYHAKRRAKFVAKRR